MEKKKEIKPYLLIDEMKPQDVEDATRGYIYGLVAIHKDFKDDANTPNAEETGKESISFKIWLYYHEETFANPGNLWLHPVMDENTGKQKIFDEDRDGNYLVYVMQFSVW